MSTSRLSDKFEYFSNVSFNLLEETKDKDEFTDIILGLQTNDLNFIFEKQFAFDPNNLDQLAAHLNQSKTNCLAIVDAIANQNNSEKLRLQNLITRYQKLIEAINHFLLEKTLKTSQEEKNAKLIETFFKAAPIAVTFEEEKTAPPKKKLKTNPLDDIMLEFEDTIGVAAEDFFSEPVITPYGNTYEKASILVHLQKKSTDPQNQEPLKAMDLIDNKIIHDLQNYYSDPKVNIDVVPDCLICPVTGRIFQNPVVSKMDSKTYECGYAPDGTVNYSNRIVEKIIQHLGPERTRNIQSNNNSKKQNSAVFFQPSSQQNSKNPTSQCIEKLSMFMKHCSQVTNTPVVEKNLRIASLLIDVLGNRIKRENLLNDHEAFEAIKNGEIDGETGKQALMLLDMQDYTPKPK